MRVLIFILLALMASTGFACPEKEARSELLSKLKNGNYEELEGYFSRLQKSYERGTLDESVLMNAYRNLYSPLPESERLFTQWLARYPSSYAARVARGIYYYKMAKVSRGCDFSAETPPENFEGMQANLVLAERDLDASLRLTAKPNISLVFLILTAQYAGDASAARQFLDMANRMAPENWLAKQKYMEGLTPRWGGSYQQMSDFLRECQRLNVSPAHLRELEALIYLDKMDVYEREKNYPAWAESLAKIRQLLPATITESSYELIRSSARYAYATKNYSEAVLYLEELVRRGNNEAWIHGQIGWIYLQQKKMPQAWVYIQRAANMQNSWAEFTVGKTTYLGCADIGLRANQSEGIRWLRRSEAHGFTEATTYLRSIGAGSR